MLFNSIEFAIFLPVVFLIYWFVVNKNLRLQNFFLLAASYFFYGWWDWRFLSLIAASSLIDYFIGIALSRNSNKTHRKLLLFTSLAVNLGFLGFFKYFNFFVESFSAAFTFFGQPVSDPELLNIVLPVGISFYTFQTLSYSIDIYRKKLEPTKDIIAFGAFVSFFPQLVAGPIERATSLLPQFYKKRVFEYDQAVDGLRQILWGLFKKVVIADNCAVYVDQIFGSHTEHSGSTLLIGGVFFAFQIYCDFSGYSDIAIGTARLFGFNLMRNFAFPYFSRDISEFWRRWHISLSTWFRDYLYIPLGGSNGGTFFKMRNIFIIFLVSGFWHGANWTFVVWGLVNALLYLPLMIGSRNRKNLGTVAEGKLIPTLTEITQMLTTFLTVVVAWVFFRAENITHAFEYLNGLFSLSLFSVPDVLPSNLIVTILLFVCAEWLQREKQHALEFKIDKSITLVRWPLYLSIIFLVIGFGGERQEFIYFNF
ncbi:membrane-bound O-acyltransferase family protein [Gammaproteobacteria bacterium 42_54_T18]|nr:membrane-bound O-acyltransferase family protein [Gammaproteobacteria bacterium 42_54_T18]